MTAHDRTPAPPLDESDLARIVTHPTCGQCGQAWSLRACGPTHALIAHERQAIVPALVVALRAAWRENARLRAGEPLIAAACAAVDAEYGGDLAVAITALRRLRVAREEYRTALAAPGAGGQATEERTT